VKKKQNEGRASILSDVIRTDDASLIHSVIDDDGKPKRGTRGVSPGRSR
jgi:hypothetical protein